MVRSQIATVKGMNRWAPRTVAGRACWVVVQRQKAQAVHRSQAEALLEGIGRCFLRERHLPSYWAADESTDHPEEEVGCNWVVRRDLLESYHYFRSDRSLRIHLLDHPFDLIHPLHRYLHPSTFLGALEIGKLFIT